MSINSLNPTTPNSTETHDFDLLNSQTLIDKSVNTAVADAIENISKTFSTSFNPALEIVKSGAAFEKNSANKLFELETQSNKIVETIDLLLDLSRETGSLNADKPVLNQTVKDILLKLESKGIKLVDLSKGDVISKDQLINLKTVTSTHIDKLRTQIQQLFNKMQNVIQNMSSVNDTVKKMISEQGDLIRKVLERSVKR